VVLLVVALLGRRLKWDTRFLQVLYGLLILTVAVSIDYIFGIYLITRLNVDSHTPAGYALLKLNTFVVIFGVILVLNKVTGNTTGDVYIQKGNLKLGLIIGICTFVVAAATAVPTAQFMFKAGELSWGKIAPILPWLLLFVLANGAQEELSFRGLFLRKLEPYLGKFMTNFIIAFVFTGLHQAADYTSQMAIFLGVTMVLALLWGYIAQKTNALWASILFHAGMDISIMIGIFANL
jgi:membrane protease YdiL (CAAX protease family)